MHLNTKNAAQAISLAGGCRCAVDSCWIPSFAGWGKVVDGMYRGFSIQMRLQVHVGMLQKTVFVTYCIKRKQLQDGSKAD